MPRTTAPRPNGEIATALAKKGIKVSPAMVATVKSTAKKKKKKVSGAPKKTSKRKKTRRATTAPLEDVKHAGDLMLQAVDLVIKAGAKEARQLVNMAEDMVKKISDKK